MITATASNLDFEVKSTKGKVELHITFPESELSQTAKLYQIKASAYVFLFMKHENKPEQVLVGRVQLYRVQRLEDGKQVVDARGLKKEVLVTELAQIPDETEFDVIVFTEREVSREAYGRLEYERVEETYASV